MGLAGGREVIVLSNVGRAVGLVGVVSVLVGASRGSLPVGMAA